MLGKAKGSPTTKNIHNVPQKIERLERYVAWGKLKPVPLEELAGRRRWEEYWQHLGVVENALVVTQDKAIEVQASIQQALDQRRQPTE